MSFPYPGRNRQSFFWKIKLQDKEGSGRYIKGAQVGTGTEEFVLNLADCGGGVNIFMVNNTKW